MLHYRFNVFVWLGCFSEIPFLPLNFPSNLLLKLFSSLWCRKNVLHYIVKFTNGALLTPSCLFFFVILPPLRVFDFFFEGCRIRQCFGGEIYYMAQATKTAPFSCVIDFKGFQNLFDAGIIGGRVVQYKPPDLITGQSVFADYLDNCFGDILARMSPVQTAKSQQYRFHLIFRGHIVTYDPDKCHVIWRRP